MFKGRRQDVRFLCRVRIKEGYMAPIHLLTGLLDQFDQNWTPVLRAFGRSLTGGDAAEWRMLQTFIFDCWLLWGPSIPVCGCARWRNEAGGVCGIAVQYGYGDESNSVPVYLAPGQQDEVLRDLQSESNAARGIARRASLIGTLMSSHGIPEGGLPVAQSIIRTGEKYDIVVEYETHEAASESGADYYSAYVWIMFEVTGNDSASGGSRWLGLLPFFEHTNIAHGATYDFMKDQLARKAVSFIARYAPESITFRYACAFDDPGHRSGSPPLPSHGKSIRDRIAGLLEADELAHVREHLALAPDGQDVLPSCNLPEVVEEFYTYVSDQRSAGSADAGVRLGAR
jgi:hypothetical protein